MAVSARDKKALLTLLEQAQLVYLLTRLPKKQVLDDPNDVTVRMSAATPIFDLTSSQIDCVNKIQIAPAVLPLAPAVAEFEFHGGVFQSGWTVALQEDAGSQSLAISDPDGAARKLLLCLGTSPEEKTLTLGALPRAETNVEATRSKGQKKRR